MRQLFAAIATVLMLTPSTLTQSAQGEDFSVKTTISEEGQVRAKIRTIFYRGRVYDISDPKGKEFTVFDPKYQRITLIDMNRKVMTKVPTKWLREFTSELKLRAPNVKSSFFINPKFKEELSENRILLTSRQLAYDVATFQPRWMEAVSAYREFADWYCQLNATNTSNLPPFPRLALNAALAKQRALPKSVRLRLPIGSKERVIVADHQYFWMLNRDDRELCETIGGHLANSSEVRVVTFEEYRKSERVALGASSKPRK